MILAYRKQLYGNRVKTSVEIPGTSGMSASLVKNHPALE